MFKQIFEYFSQVSVMCKEGLEGSVTAVVAHRDFRALGSINLCREAPFIVTLLYF